MDLCRPIRSLRVYISLIAKKKGTEKECSTFAGRHFAKKT